MKEDTCWDCGKKMLHKKVEFKLLGVSLGKFPAIICEKCNEPYFDEKTSDKMSKIAKKKGLWGLQAKTKVGEAGKTLDIRLPKRLIEFFGLKKGEEVTLTPENKKKLVVTI